MYIALKVEGGYAVFWSDAPGAPPIRMPRATVSRTHPEKRWAPYTSKGAAVYRARKLEKERRATLLLLVNGKAETLFQKVEPSPQRLCAECDTPLGAHVGKSRLYCYRCHRKHINALARRSYKARKTLLTQK